MKSHLFHFKFFFLFGSQLHSPGVSAGALPTVRKQCRSGSAALPRLISRMLEAGGDLGQALMGKGLPEAFM